MTRDLALEENTLKSEDIVVFIHFKYSITELLLKLSRSTFVSGDFFFLFHQGC